jgi:hypothetical protein
MVVFSRVNPALPRLAWIVELDRVELAVSAIVGSSVECGPDFLVAGVWNGPFRAGDFDLTDCSFGSGMTVRNDCVTFVPSAAFTEAIYYSERASRLIAANSLPLLLAATEDQLDPHFAFYDRTSESLQTGIDNYERAIPTKQGRVHRVFVRNLQVTRSSIEEVDKRPPPSFDDFGSYSRYLTDSYAGIYRNIRDPDRQHPLDIVSTQSRGYDTTAVNAVASKHEIDAVFTVPEVKESGAFAGTAPPSRDSDDGTDICEALGLKATRLERRHYTQSFDEEYLFYAATNHAEAVKLLGMKPHLRRDSVMLTGVRGDVVWATDKYFRDRCELLVGGSENKMPSYLTDGTEITPEMLHNDMRGPDTWLHGLSELGLEWGLIQVVLTYIGDRNRPDIFRVTMSPEMAPWRLGNDYDRPIARRIAEEIGGIPGELFGQQKRAVATSFPEPPVPAGAQLRREYFRFLHEHRVASSWWRLTYRLVHRINARIIFHTPRHYRYVYYAHRLLSKLAGRAAKIPILYRQLDGRLYCFCVNKRVKDYETAMARDMRGAGLDKFSIAAE